MEMPKDLVLEILQLKITAIFKLFNDRHELCGERNLTIGRRSYAVGDIESTKKCYIKDLTEEDLKRGNFKTIEDFEKWWLSRGYHKDAPINVIYFEILRFKPLGKYYLKKMGRKIPRIRGD